MKTKIIQIGVVLFLCGILTATYYALNDQSFYEYIAYTDIQKVADNSHHIYVVLSSDTCVTCKKLESDLKELSKEHLQIAEIKFYCVRLDESNCADIFQQYQIDGAPAILKFTNGVYDEMLYQQITQEKIMAFIS